MSAKFTFRLKSEERSRDLPNRVLIAQSSTETTTHVVLKLLGYVLFHRERLQMETSLEQSDIHFVPDLVELDYTMKPVLWVECGECSVAKLDKLAVKANEAEIWVLKRSAAEAEQLHQAMAKQGLRRNRYRLMGFDAGMFAEMLELLTQRNELHWFRGSFDPPQLQFEFNGLWFDSEFMLLRF